MLQIVSATASPRFERRDGKWAMWFCITSRPTSPARQDLQFVTDCVRAAKGLITDNELQAKYELSPADWQAITKDTALIKAIRAERERRIYSGVAARELAATQFATAPRILGEILTDKTRSARHRIESAKELRQTAHGAANEGAAGDGTKFVITINLGEGHVEHYEKEIAPMSPLLPANAVNIDGE
jgi:hypothetical protein